MEFILITSESIEKLPYCNIEFIAEYIWVPIILPLVIAIYKLIVNDKFLYVKEIRKSTDSDISFFVELYNIRVASKYRICSEEILSYIAGDRNDDIQHHLYICKKFNKTVGFIKFMLSKSQKYIFIAYIAIDDSDAAARKKGVKLLLNKVCKKYFKPQIANKIIIEAEKSNAGHYSAFSKLITRYAKSKKKKAYIYDFDYIQPNMPDDEYNSIPEEHMSFVFVPYYLPSHKTINKNVLLNIVRMIYYDIYCPSCNCITNCCELDYSRYLEKIISHYKQTLPDTINLISLE